MDSIRREKRADTLVFLAAAKRFAVSIVEGSAVRVSLLFRIPVSDTYQSTDCARILWIVNTLCCGLLAFGATGA